MILRNLEVKTFSCKGDKSPATINGFKDATYENQPEEGSVYGVATGAVLDKNGNEKYLLVIDVDNKNSGMFNWNIWSFGFEEEQLDTYTVRTPSGGKHLYYQLDLPMDIKPQLCANVDVKFVGGYVIGANSVSNNGTYEVINDKDILPLSADMFRRMKKRFENKTFNKDVSIEPLTDEDMEKIVEGLSNNREWDVDYNSRFAILTAMKKLGFDFLDFTNIIVGSLSGKTLKEWKTSWNSPVSEITNGDYWLLFKFSKHFPSTLNTDNDNAELPMNQSVKTNKDAIKLALDMYSKRFLKIIIAPNIYILDLKTEREIKKDTFFDGFCQNIYIIDDERTVSAASLFFKNAKLIDGYSFDPTTTDMLINKDGLTYFNSWKGLKYNVEPNYDLSKCSLIMDYIYNVMANEREEVATLIHQFVAKTCLNPTDRVNSFALVAHSIEEGTGKSFFGEFLMSIIGTDNAAKIGSVKDLESENNALKNKVFVYVDENANQWNKSQVDMMKDYITGSVIRVKQKYVSSYPITNNTHWYFNSNDINTAPLGMFDRRYMVVKVSTKYLQNKKYYNALMKEMENPEAIENYLGYINQFKDDVITLPETEERIEQKKLNASPVLNWLFSLIEEESIEWNIYNSPDYMTGMKNTGGVRNTTILYNLFCNYVGANYKNIMIKSRKNFTAELVAYGFLNNKRTSFRDTDGETKNYYAIMTRDQLKNKYLKFTTLDEEEEILEALIV